MQLEDGWDNADWLQEPRTGRDAQGMRRSVNAPGSHNRVRSGDPTTTGLEGSPGFPYYTRQKSLQVGFFGQLAGCSG